MYLTISHAEWMQNTTHWRRKRGERLRELDEAIWHYEQAKDQWFKSLNETPHRRSALVQSMWLVGVMESGYRSIVRDAFRAWAANHGDWREDARNEKGMFTRLEKELTYLDSKLMDQSDRDALELLKQARHGSIEEVFAGARLVLGSPAKVVKTAAMMSLDAGMLGRGIATQPWNNVEAGTRNAEIAATTGTEVYSVISDAFDIPNVQSIPAAIATIGLEAGDAMADLVKGLFADFWKTVAEAVPGLSVAVTGVRFAVACKQAYSAHSAQGWLFREFEGKLEDSEPLAAVRAISELYLREERQAEIDAARFAGGFAVSAANAATLGLLTPVQEGYTAANAALAIAQQLYVLGREFKEIRRVNEIIRSGRVDRAILTTCPLLGAYYLTTVPHSHVIMQFTDPSHPTFQTDVEYIRRHELDRLLSMCRRVISKSHFTLMADPRGDMGGTKMRPFAGALKER